jgi:predicted RNA-binding protein
MCEFNVYLNGEQVGEDVTSLKTNRERVYIDSVTRGSEEIPYPCHIIAVSASLQRIDMVTC